MNDRELWTVPGHDPNVYTSEGIKELAEHTLRGHTFTIHGSNTGATATIDGQMDKLIGEELCRFERPGGSS